MRKHNVVGIVLFCSFLFAMAAGYLLPSVDFSEMEKRYLAEAPVFSWKSALSGDWSHQAEDYLTDHVPCRNLFVGLNAYLELLAGRQKLKDVWLEDGKLIEAPAAPDETVIARNMKAINKFADDLQQEVHLMVVPSAGWADAVPEYRDEEALDLIYGAAGPHVVPIPVEEIFRGKPELYYNTDHHWTSRGAYLGYAAAAEAMGRAYPSADAFEVTEVPGFQGSTYSRSALWLTPSESIELWQGSHQLTVTNEASDQPHDGIFYRERLEQADKYTVFLDGNHSLVRIQNPEKQGKLLVIRDSYSNCLGGFLAESYGEVVLADLRYYRQALSQLAQQEQFDNILVCYSCANFLTDTNIVTLR